jgi:hypothetical protein
MVVACILCIHYNPTIGRVLQRHCNVGDRGHDDDDDETADVA